MFTQEQINKSDGIKLSMHEMADAVYGGTKALKDCLKNHVVNVVGTQMGRTPEEEALVQTYCRMYAWMESLVVLNRTVDLQAISAGARSLFEFLLDIKLLCKDPTNVSKFHAFTFVEKFRAAKNLVEISDELTGDTTKWSEPRTFFSNAANKARFSGDLATHWPGLNKPPPHWSGRTLPDRAKDIGIDYELIYRHLVARLNWYIHPGQSGIDGLSDNGFVGGFALANDLAQRCTLEATDIICDKFHLLIADADLRKKIEATRNYVGLAFVKAQIDAAEKIEHETRKDKES